MKKSRQIELLFNIVRTQNDILQKVALEYIVDGITPKTMAKLDHVGYSCAETYNAILEGEKTYEECKEIFLAKTKISKDEPLEELKDVLEALMKDLENASVKTNK